MYVGPQLRWTDFIINILKKIGTDLGFEVAKEYFGIDVGYFTVDSKDRFDWNLDVAIEHENSDKTWMDEVCKLAHIAAQQKILIAYYNYLGAEESLESMLERAVERIKSRKYKTRPQSWVFIFGPTSVDINHSFKVFEYDAEIDEEARKLKGLEHKYPLKAA